MNVVILENWFSLHFCQRHHEKKNIYNLNEDEELTHYGQSLADIEKHNAIVDSDSDDEERGMLSGKVGGAAPRAWGLGNRECALDLVLLFSET